MKKLRLLLMLLVSMLAIGGYAQGDWVEQQRSWFLQESNYANLGNYIYAPTGDMVYIHQFEYCIGGIGDPRNTILKEDSVALPVDRKLSNEIHAHCTYVFKPNSTIPFEDRRESQYVFFSYLTDAYSDTIFMRDETLNMQNMLQLSYGIAKEAVIQSPGQAFVTRGGEYIVEAHNNLDNRPKMKLTLTCDPDCDLKVEGGAYIGEYYEVRVNIASGYPYNVKDYQGKKMHLRIFDADNNPVVNDEIFEINASPDSAKMEYVKSFSHKFWLNSPKFTIKLSGDLLKEEKVVIKDALPNYFALNEDIRIADSICNAILNNPDNALFISRNVKTLKEAIDKAKEGLELSAYEQSLINKYDEDLRFTIRLVLQRIKQGFIEVNDVKSLRDAIESDGAAQIHLASDIDVSSVTEPFIYFAGIINGSKDPSHPEGPMYTLTGGSANAPFFEECNSAIFENIAFNHFKMSDKNSSIGVIARTADRSIFRNIKMEDIMISCGGNAGTIVANSRGDGEFDHIYVTKSYISADGQAGGVAGNTGESTFRNCYTDRNVFIYGSYSGGGISSYGGAVFVECENQACVGAKESCVGGISGRSYDIVFRNCINSGKIIPGDKEECEKCYRGEEFTLNSNSSAVAGGICGIAWGYGDNNIADQCSNYGKIYGNSCGILAVAEDMLITNCLNADNSLTFAGIVGDALRCKLINCLNLADCPTVHSSKDMNPEIGNNYCYISNNSNRIPASYEMCVTEETLKSGIVARWLNNGVENRKDGIEPWRQNLVLQGDETEVDSYPVLDSSHRVVTTDLLTRNSVISTVEELLSFCYRVNDGQQFLCACLGNDIDMTGYPWEPIGKDEANKHFRGIFDGQGHTISGLTYTSENNEPVGLFGAVHANAEIRNVTVGKGSKFVCADSSGNPSNAGAGGIVGKVYIGWNWGTVVIENCGSHADIEVGRHGGGILGNVDAYGDDVRVYVTNCFSMGKITASDSNSGLLCGYMKKHGVVRNSWSGGTLETSDVLKPAYDCLNPKNHGEYLVGYTDRLDIKNCYIVDAENKIEDFNAQSAPIQEGVDSVNIGELSSGNLVYRLNGGTNDATKSLIWQQNLGTDTIPVCGNKGVYHARKNCNEYGTVCLPYSLMQDINTSYYVYDSFTHTNDGVQLKFKTIIADFGGVVPAGVPVLFRVRNTGENSFNDSFSDEWVDNPSNPETTNPETAKEWDMYGTFTNTLFDGIESLSIYYVSDGAIKNGRITTVPPYRAYFRGPDINDLLSDGGAAKVRIIIDDEDGETTAIELIGDELVPALNNELAPFSGKTYSLMGTEVGDDYHGIVIKNGKKVFQK